MFSLISDRNITSVFNDTIAHTFFNCLGQLVLIFRELTFCTAQDRLPSKVAHKFKIELAAGWAAGAGLGDALLLVHVFGSVLVLVAVERRVQNV